MPKDINDIQGTTGTTVNKTVTLQNNEVNTLSFSQQDLAGPPTLDVDGNLVFHLTSGETFTIQNFRGFAEANASCGPDSLIQLSDATIIYPQQLLAELSGTQFNALETAAGTDPSSPVLTVLQAPTVDQTEIVAIERGHQYKFGFDLTQTSMEQRGEDLVVSFKDGGTLIMQNYFEAATCDTPATLALADGVVVDPQNVLALTQFDQAENGDTVVAGDELRVTDVEPAAGEEKVAQQDAPTDVEPAAGNEQLAQMSEAAQELADIEPAAGAPGGAAARGYGFQSSVDIVNLNGVADIGPIAPTALNYVAPSFTPGEFFFVTPAAGTPLTPPLVDIGENLQTLEDNNIGLPIVISNPGAGNTVTITITGIPTGWTVTGPGTFTPGVGGAAGTWTYRLPTGQGFSGIGPKFLPPLNSDVDALDLPYTVSTTNGTQTVNVNGLIDIVVDAVADPPTLDVPDNNSGISGQPVDLTINTAVTDTDGTESISKIVVRGLPDGFTLSAGTYDPVEKTWTLTPAQLANLKVTAPVTFSGTVNFFVESHVHDQQTDGEFNLTNNDTFVVDRVSFSWIRPDTTPDVGNDTKSVDETGTAPLTVTGTVPADFKTDGPGVVTGSNVFTSAGSRAGGALSSGGEPVSVMYDTATKTYTGSAGGLTIFTLVINPNGTYSFTLNHPLDHADATNPNDVISLNFGVTGTDADGDTDGGVITINIVDDAPVAANDTISTGTNPSATGNVLTNDNLSNDVGSTGNLVTKIVWNGTTYNVPATGTLTISATYGTLVIGANGAYTYTSKNISTGTDTFTYTVVDSDGDSSTATLGATVGDLDTVPVIGNDSKTIDETTNAPITVTGSVSTDFKADGPGTVTGNNTFTSTGSVTTGGLKANGVAVSVTYDATTKTYTGKAGTVTVFSLVINADGTYSFTLNKPLDHADGANANDVIALNFGVIGTDSDNDTDTGTITINIVDDAPVAANDVISTNSGPGATGNVLTNDNLSNDYTNTVTKVVFNGTTVNVNATGTTTIQGVYGTLVIRANGTYTYTSKNTATGTDVFTYTVRDADGDTSTATLTATVGDVDSIPVIGDSVKTVDETTLGPIVVNGTVPANFGTDTPGTIRGNNTFTSGGSNGGALKANGVAVTVSYDATTNTYTGKAGTVTVFTLLINADGTYTFTQIKPLDHADGTNPNDVLSLNFGVIGSDADGDTDTGTITINIVDDAPSAANDTIASNGAAANGNVLTNDNLSNDYTNTVTKIVFNGTTYNVPGTGTLTVQGTYGTLVIGANGAYTYTSKNTGTGSDVFTYTVRDADGDTSTANLTATVGDIDTVPVIGNDTKAVDETTLNATVTGTVPADFKADGPGTIKGNNTFTATGSMTGGSLKSGGVAVAVTYDATTQTYTGKAGTVTVFTLVINANGTYTYTQVKPLDHADGSNANDVISLNFGVIGQDSDNDTDTGTITINVADDGPVAANDTISTGATATGNVLTNDNLSNDVTNTVTKVVFNGTTYNVPGTGTISITGQYGTLVIGANGAYTYTSRNTGTGTDSFTYTLQDSDGDTSTATLAATITDLDTVPVIGNDTKSVDETSLNATVTGNVSVDFKADGPGTVAGNNVFTSGGSRAGGTLSSGGTAVTVTYDATTKTYTAKAGTVTVFSLVINNDGSYTYTQFKPLDHADGTNPNDVITLNFGVIGTDTDGDTDTGTITINVADDGPVAANDTITSNGPAATGNVLTNDNLSNDVANTVTKIVFNGTTYNVPTTGNLTVQGTYGTLVISKTGAYTYTSKNTGTGSDTFTYTVVDSDGDSSTANLTATVGDVDTVPVIGDSVKTIDETNLGPITINGSVPADFKADAPGAIAGNNTFTSGGSNGGTLKSGGVAVTVTYDATTKTYTGKAGTVTVFSLVINTDGTYSFTLNKPLDHADGTNPNDVLTLNFGVIGTDADGDSDTGTITVNIVDDAPSAANDTIASNGPAATGNVLTNDNLSNDVANTVTKIVFNGTAYNVPGTGTLTVQGTYGTLVIGANGAYTYTSKNTGTGSDVFTYTVVDRDGDSSTANLTATVGDIDTVPVIGDCEKTIDETSTFPLVVNAAVPTDYKADGPGTLAGNNTFSSGGSNGGTLKSDGVAVSVSYNATTNTYTGTAGGTTVFTLVINANGTYTFTLLKPLDHADASNPDDVIDLNFGVIGTDADGDTDTGTIIIHVHDDGPVAANDTVTSNGPAATGNVTTNDNLSNDVDNTVTKIVFNGTTYNVPGTGTVTVQGTYGTLVIGATGAYTYTSRNTGTGSDVFTYTLRDNDGDTSTATLTATVGDIDTVPVIGNDAKAVDESTLMTGVTGSVSVDWRADGPGTVAGNNSFSSGGSRTNNALTSNGAAVNVTYDATSKTYIGTANGMTVFSLVINGDGTYSFTLNRPLDHADGTNPNDVITLNFGVIGTDADGDTDTGTITISVADDAPVAVNDTLSTTTVATGNVLSNDNLSNDTANTVTKIVFNGTTYNVPGTGTISITGQYGTLVIGANGAYTYTSRNTTSGTDTFTYTVVDRDGDSSTANLSATISDIDTVPVIGNDTKSVDETTLSTSVSGSVSVDWRADGPGTVAGNNSFTAGGSLDGGSLKSGGVAVAVTYNATTKTYTGAAGGTTVFTLVINNDGTYTYTQVRPLDHADGTNPNDVITLNFGVVGTDSDGDADTGTITINVADDGPVAANDSITSNGPAATGNVLANDNLSNDVANTVTKIVFNGTTYNVPGTGTLTVQGTYGTLVIGANGAYTYTSRNSGTGTDAFTYTVVDSDGDSSTATLNASVGDIDTVPVIGDDTKAVDESTLSTSVTGTVPADFKADAPGSIAGNNSFSAGGSLQGGSLKSDGVAVSVTYNASTKTYTGTANGLTVFSLVINANGTYTYTQSRPLDHADASNPNDVISLNFGVVGTDSDGDSDTGTITINVADDGPVAVNDTAAVNGNNGALSVSGNVTANDNLSNDVANTVTQIIYNGTTYNVPGTGVLSLNGVYGTLVISANGDYSYTSRNTAVGTDNFTYVLVDGDGDSSTATLGLTVQDIDTVPVVGDSVRTTDETTLGPNILSGTLPADFGADTPGNITGNNSFNAGGSLAGGGLRSGGTAVNVTYNAATNTYTGMAGSVVVFSLVINGNGTYTYTQNAALDHAQPADPNDVITLNFGVIGTDSDGDTDTGVITINVVDDAPTAANDTATLTGNSITGNVLANDQVGNDLTGSPITSVVFNGTTYTVPGSGTVSITGVYGTLVIGANGAYTYTRAGAAGGSDAFTYTVRDGDGDTAFATLTLTAPMIDTVPDIGDDVKTIDETNLSPTVVVNGSVPVDFKANTPGTVTATGVGTFGASGSLMDGVLSHHGTAINVTLSGNTYVGTAGGQTAFTLQINANGTYTFTQYLTLDHEACPDPNDVITLRFGVTGTDSDGDTDTGTITINVADDAPVAVNDGFSLNGATNISGNVLLNDDRSNEPNTDWLVKTVAFGSNSFVLPQNGAQLTIIGNYGTLRINKDGSFTYAKRAGATGTDVFTYSLWDWEGDFSNATLTINTGNGPTTFSSTVSSAAPAADDTTAADTFSAQAVNADDQWHAVNTVEMNGHENDGGVYGTDNADTFHLTTLPSGAVHIEKFSTAEGDVLDLSSVLGHIDTVSGAIDNFVFKTEVNGSTIISVDVNGTGDVNNAMQVAVLNDVVDVDLQKAVLISRESI